MKDHAAYDPRNKEAAKKHAPNGKALYDSELFLEEDYGIYHHDGRRKIHKHHSRSRRGGLHRIKIKGSR